MHLMCSVFQVFCPASLRTAFELVEKAECGGSYLPENMVHFFESDVPLISPSVENVTSLYI